MKKKEELGCQALPNHAARLGSVFTNVLVRLCSLWLWEERPVLAVPCREEGEMPFRGCVIAVGRDVEQLLGVSGMAEGKMPPGMIRALYWDGPGSLLAVRQGHSSAGRSNCLSNQFLL